MGAAPPSGVVCDQGIRKNVYESADWVKLSLCDAARPKGGKRTPMIEMEKPHIEAIEISSDGSYGRFVVEPLERGFGTTLGNSLRRVLLSSIPGAAITSVYIDGVLHEFSTIEGVLEDVTEIILNLKRVALRIHSDEEKILEIEAEGAGTVKAEDIRADSDVEILNASQHIATLTENARLYMRMTARRGRGYVGAENNKREDAPIAVLPVDALYSPVVRVNYTIEDTRVGQITNYDRLILEVWTDRTVRPDEAVAYAARILTDHLSLFTGLSGGGDPGAVLVERSSDPMDRIFEMPIEDLDLSVRSYNSLKRAGINTVQELIMRTEEDMMKIRNLGKKSLEEIRVKLSELGLDFRKEE